MPLGRSGKSVRVRMMHTETEEEEEEEKNHCRVKMAQVRHEMPNSGLGFQAQVFEPL